MCPKTDTDTARRWHKALGATDQEQIDALISPDLVWDITPMFPGGGTYEGAAAIFDGYLPQSSTHFTSMSVRIDEVLGNGSGRGAVRGAYLIVAKDGRTGEARFAHVWTIADGRLTRMDHVGESAVLQGVRQDGPHNPVERRKRTRVPTTGTIRARASHVSRSQGDSVLAGCQHTRTHRSNRTRTPVRLMRDALIAHRPR